VSSSSCCFGWHEYNQHASDEDVALHPPLYAKTPYLVQSKMGGAQLSYTTILYAMLVWFYKPTINKM